MKRALNISEISMMPKSKVTIAIPTYNRSQLLKGCLKSVLTQDYSDFHVVALDNASSDDTETVVQSFDDSRITYIRNEMNIGLFGNWNRALEVSSSPYLTILPDDDVILPGFIRESVTALDEYPSVAFSAGVARYIDFNGTPLHLQDAGDMPDGLSDGLEYLHRIVAGPDWVIHPATVMMRSAVLSSVGSFQAPHAKQLLDMNLYIRMAACFDMIFMRKEVAQVRLHPEQVRQREFDAIEGTRPLAVIAERTDAVAYLLQSVLAEDLSYRRWLAERLLSMNRDRGELTGLLVPSLMLSLAKRLEFSVREIVDLIPPGERFILVDENLWKPGNFPSHCPLPFLERDGLCWGNPPDDETAIREVERICRSGVNFMVFAWPAFWWFEYYSRFYNHLRSNFRCVLQNERLVVFNLRT
jgi:glycosyltransferase involved in cell wall biosynthesis